MAVKFNPFTGKLEEYGPVLSGTGTVSAAADGTAAIPGISFANDLNTGIYRPGPDQLAISTNGTGRLFVDASGNVGVGVTSPRQALTFGSLTSSSTSTPDCIDLGATYTSTSASTNLKFKLYTDSSGNTYGFTVNGSSHLEYYAGTVSSPGNHVFLTGGSERARIDSSGRLLVGTSTALTASTAGFGRLQVLGNSANNGQGILSLGNGGNRSTLGDGSAIGQIYFTDNAAAEYAVIECFGDGVSSSGSDTPGRLVFSTTADGASSPTERLRIDSSGRVGIGTSSPTQIISANGNIKVQNSTVSTKGFVFDSPASNWGPQESGLYFVPADGVNGRADFKISLWDGTGTIPDRFYINGSSGNVGIGTTPAQQLHVKGSGDTKLLINSSNNASDRGIYFATSTDSEVYGYLSQEYSTGYLTLSAGTGAYQVGMRFNTAGSERARIDSSGRLLVGTSSSSAAAKLIVQGNTSDGAAGGLAQLQIGSTTPASEAVLGRLDFSDSAGYQGAWIRGERDGGTWTSGSSQPGRLVFSTTADGAPSPTERMRIGQNGYFKASTNGTYNGTDVHNFYQSNTNAFGLIVGGYGSYTSTVFVLQGTNATSTAFNLIEGYYGGNQTTGSGASLAIRVRGDGDITNLNNSYGAISDIKLKENIVNANSQWDDIKTLQVRNYNLKEGQTHTQIGLIAQEVELVSPGLVSESPDRDEDGNDLGTVTKSVNYSVLYMKAVKALQEAMERIETLEAKVAALEA